MALKSQFKIFKLKVKPKYYFAACYLILPFFALGSETFQFNSKKQSLQSALSLWSKTTNLNYISSPDLLKNKLAPALNGAMTGPNALKALLSDTKLIFTQKPDGTVLIHAVKKALKPTTALKLDEEIIVTGFRASLNRALDIKREALGIVEAISSIDINKFPDTNLAEALQRISGVSIDRINNEGNKVTVRGLGPDFNLVTLNGRQMPVTAIPEISSINSLAPATRSFEFVNVSADGISSVEVHKTSQANRLSGGIGAAIDIKTHRPLNQRSEVLSFSAKGVLDTSSNKSASPELSAVLSKTFAENSVGVFISGIYQERDSTIEEAIIDGWVGKSTAINEWYSHNSYEVSNLIVDNKNQHSDGYNWAPISQHFLVTNINRQRKNGQITLQYTPTKKIKTTLDISYQAMRAQPKTIEFGSNYFGIPRDNLFGQDLTSSIDANGTTSVLSKTDAIYQYQQRSEEFINKTHSHGLNISYQVTEDLSLFIDGHDAKAHSQRLVNNLQVLELGANKISFDGRYQVPAIDIEIDDPFTSANLTTLTEPQPYTTFQQSMRNKISQLHLGAHWENNHEGWLNNLSLGFEEVSVRNKASVHENVFVTYWTLDFGILPETNAPEKFFDHSDVSNILQQFSGGSHNINYIYSSDFNSEQSTTELLTEGENFECYCTEPLAEHFVSEISDSVYLHAQFEGDIWQMPLLTSTGIRYEKTSISVSSLMSVPESIDWVDPRYTQIKYADERTYERSSNQYTSLLPSFTTSLEVLDGLLLRTALSRSLSRTDLMQVRNQTSILSSLSSELNATRGNPALKPYTSDNFDASIEWYYEQDSFVTVGYFRKHIKNFISTESSDTELYGLSNVYIGERAEIAREQLINEGLEATDTNVLLRIIENGGATLNQDGEAVVSSNSTDPVLTWTLKQPKNNQKAKLSGWEFAVQHLFSESGWGGSFNYTLVESNKNYELRTEGYQFAMPGISDTFNIVGFYEKDKFKIRLAYNWRDQFLNSLTTFTGDHPQFTEAYEQLDFSIAYNWTKKMSLSLEGINITAQNQRIYSRYKEQLISAKQFGSIYTMGINYRF